MKLREINQISTEGSKYGLEVKPEWYDRAVALKKANPDISLVDISKEVGASPQYIGYWLTGSRPASSIPMMKRDSFPFKPSDFPSTGARKYFHGAKPEWYDQALQMAKAGETFTAIAKKFGIVQTSVGNWLVKGRKHKNSGTLINPDAELEPRKITGKKLDVNLLMDFISDGYTDEDIVELIRDDRGIKTASHVKSMLPVLRQKQNPGTQVIDKTASGLNNPVARPPKVNIPAS